MVTKVKQKSKGAKKSFYEVEAPMTAVKISLYGSSAEEFDGKVVTLDLTKSLRGKSLELRMKVKHDNGKLKAEPVSAKLTGSYIRANMRRGTDYVEDSFIVNCKDSIVSVKPFLIARRSVSRAVRRALREDTRKFLEGYSKIRTIKDLFSEIMANKIQRGMASRLKKIYPLAFCEIRTFEVLGNLNKEEEKEKLEKEKKEDFAKETTKDSEDKEMKKEKVKEKKIIVKESENNHSE